MKDSITDGQVTPWLITGLYTVLVTTPPIRAQGCTNTSWITTWLYTGSHYLDPPQKIVGGMKYHQNKVHFIDYRVLGQGELKTMAGITTKKGSPLKQFIIDIASPSTKDQNQKRIKTKKGSIKKLLPPKKDHYLQRIIINKGSSKTKDPHQQRIIIKKGS